MKNNLSIGFLRDLSGMDSPQMINTYNMLTNARDKKIDHYGFIESTIENKFDNLTQKQQMELLLSNKPKPISVKTRYSGKKRLKNNKKG